MSTTAAISSPSHFTEICSALTANEPIFAAIAAAYGYPPFWKRTASFDSLVQIILEQQVSLDSARAHYLRLRSFVPQITPQQLLNISDADYFFCQVTRQKASYLRALSEAVLSGALSLDALETMDNNAVTAALCTVKGIGIWTSNVYLMFCLSRSDCFPQGDIAAINTLRTLFPHWKEKSLPELYAAAEKWAPHKTVATFFLWWWYLKSKGRKLPDYY